MESPGFTIALVGTSIFGQPTALMANLQFAGDMNTIEYHMYIYIYIFVYIYIYIYPYIYMYISIHTIIISYGDMNIVYFQLYLLVVYLSMVARQDPIGWGTSKNHSQTTDHVALFHLQKYQR